MRKKMPMQVKSRSNPTLTIMAARLPLWASSKATTGLKNTSYKLIIIENNLAWNAVEQVAAEERTGVRESTQIGEDASRTPNPSSGGPDVRQEALKPLLCFIFPCGGNLKCSKKPNTHITRHDELAPRPQKKTNKCPWVEVTHEQPGLQSTRLDQPLCFKHALHQPHFSGKITNSKTTPPKTNPRLGHARMIHAITTPKGRNPSRPPSMLHKPSQIRILIGSTQSSLHFDWKIEVWKAPNMIRMLCAFHKRKDLQRTLVIARNGLHKVVVHKRIGIYMHFSLFMGRMHRPPKCVSCGVCPKILHRHSYQHPWINTYTPK